MDTITQHLRAQYNAPNRLTSEFLDEQMEVLEGWHKDAADMARDSDSRIQEGVEHLVGAMTDDEIHAARAIYASVRPLILRQTQTAYERMGPPDHEVSLAEMDGITWAIYVRCLATYEPSRSHLTTWLTLESRKITRKYLLDIRDRDDTSSLRRARRKILRLESTTQDPRREDYVKAVRSVHAYRDASAQHVSQVVDYLISPDTPLRLDARDDEGNTLYNAVPAPDRPARIDPREVGKRLARRLGKEDLWTTLTDIDQ